MNVHLVDRATAEDKLERKWSIAFWSRLKRKPERVLDASSPHECRIHVFIRKDWENRPEDFVLHDRVVHVTGYKIVGSR